MCLRMSPNLTFFYVSEGLFSRDNYILNVSYIKDRCETTDHIRYA